MGNYVTTEIVRNGQVATVVMLNRREEAAKAGASSSSELARAFTELRGDDSIRVVVLTGTDGQFKVPGPSHAYASADMLTGLSEPTSAWRTFANIIRCHQTIVEMEKPVVAKVNGDAIGFGSSLAFASDLIFASDEAKFMDHHMSGIFTAKYDGQLKEGGHAFSSVPGDGGLAFVPLFMSPCKAKEYLMLAESYEARELARLGIINRAVPGADLDAVVDDVVRRLLQRDAYALAWTKRVANRRVAEHLNATLDAGVGYEMVSFLHRERLGGANIASLD